MSSETSSSISQLNLNDAQQKGSGVSIIVQDDGRPTQVTNLPLPDASHFDDDHLQTHFERSAEMAISDFYDVGR